MRSQSAGRPKQQRVHEIRATRVHAPTGHFSGSVSRDVHLQQRKGKKKRGKPQASARLNRALGIPTLAIGLLWLARPLFHIIWHHELSFLPNVMTGLLVVTFSVLLLRYGDKK